MSFWQILTSLDNFWQILISFDKFWQILTSFDKFWQILTSFDKFFQVLTCFDIFGKVWTNLEKLTGKNIQIWRSMHGNQENRLLEPAGQVRRIKMMWCRPRKVFKENWQLVLVTFLSHSTEWLLKNGPPSQIWGFLKFCSNFFGEKPKQTGKTNLFWPPECRVMEDIYSWLEKNSYIYKFHLENGNIKKLSWKYLETAKTSPFSLQLLVMIGYTSQWVLVTKNNCFEKRGH